MNRGEQRRANQELIDRLPPPGDTPLEKLRHTIAAFAGAPDDGWVAKATCGKYGDGVVTGLTWGDLRSLASEPTPDAPWYSGMPGPGATDADITAHLLAGRVERLGARIRDLGDRVAAAAPRVAAAGTGLGAYPATSAITDLVADFNAAVAGLDLIGLFRDAADVDGRYTAEKLADEQRATTDTGTARLAEWLVGLDQPGNADRQTVTLNQIIERAQQALADSEGHPL